MAGQLEKTSSSVLWVPVQPNLKPLDPPVEHQAAWEVARASFGKLVAPLGIPIFVGPGSIGTTIIYASEARDRATMLGLVGVLSRSFVG
ncbi:hypothetical protein HC928_25020, partial [bacterium]|nr:hypothetical protein [bacterium]